jgi:hypothetical protein
MGVRLSGIGGSCIARLVLRSRRAEQFPRMLDVVDMPGSGEQSVIADAVESGEHDVADLDKMAVCDTAS